MIRGAIKKLMKKYGGRISDEDRAAGMNFREQEGMSAGKMATALRKRRLAKNNLKVGVAAAVGAGAYELSGDSATKLLNTEGVKLGDNGTLELRSKKTGNKVSVNIKRLKSKGYSDDEIVKLARYALNNGHLPKGVVESSRKGKV